MVRDLLAGELHGWPDGTVPGSGWPERVLPATGLPGFAAELRELLLRAAERSLGPEELQKLGEQQDVPEWAAAGRFFRTYEQVVLLRGAAVRKPPGPRHRRWTPPSSSVPRSMPWPAIPSCSPPSGRGYST